MQHDTKIHVQPERIEKQKEHKSPIQSQKTATPDLANLTQTDIQHLSPADVISLSGIIGNRAVARLLAQRQEEDDEEEFEGPRTKPLREDAVKERGGAELRSSPVQRGARVTGLASVGDATNVDSEGCYGWDRPMSATDVASVVNNLVTTHADIVTGKTIYIFSGTHGTSTGNLVSTGAAGFVGEDQATANQAMASSVGTQIEVIDVPNTYTTKDSLSPAFTSTDYVRILAWCYSRRSYNNSASIKSNWWPAPDHI